MSTANEMKITVVLNASGQVAGASKEKAYTPGQGEEAVVSFGVVADPGQTLVEVEVPSHVAALEGSELLAHLAGHASIKAAIESSSAVRHTNAVTQGTDVSYGTI